MKDKFLISVISVLLLVSNIRAEIYLWPVHGSRRLSSTFGEFRDGHYHAGIDLRTFGRVGLPCLAVGNGTVSRVRIAPSGYGKALYLKLVDGITVVYAHLSGFDRALDSLTYFERLRRSSSWCDIMLSGGRFGYSVGDTVAYTGDSGAIAPHLHFEMRDEGSRPFNPLENLYRIPDNVPPIISGLEVIPLSPGSVVNGRLLPVISLFRVSGEKYYVMEDTLQLEGTFGLGVSVWDEQGYGSYGMAPLSIELYVDGQPLYRMVNKSFSYTQTKEIALEYDTKGEGIAGRYTLLFRREGNSRLDREGSGIFHSDAGSTEGLCLETGLHRAEIRARDSSGNESRAVFHFALHRYPVIDIAMKLSAASEVVVSSHDPDGGTVTGGLYESLDGGSNWMEVGLERFGKYYRSEASPIENALYRYEVRDDEGALSTRYFGAPERLQGEDKVFCECIPEAVFDGLVIRITTDRILASAPRARVVVGRSSSPCVMHQIGPREYTVMVSPLELRDGVNIFHISGIDYRGYLLRSGSGFQAFSLSSEKGISFNLSEDLRVGVHAQSIRGQAVCLVREVNWPGEIPAGLRFVSCPFLIDFPAARLIKPLSLECEPGKKVGLFRWEESKGWKCIGVPGMEGGRVAIDRGGVYAFFMDGLPPEVAHVEIRRQPSGSGFFKPYGCYLPVVEEGCGIDPYSAVAFIDGRRVVCEWDEFRKVLYVPVLSSTPGRTVALKVEISDRAGNMSVGEFSFMIE